MSRGTLLLQSNRSKRQGYRGRPLWYGSCFFISGEAGCRVLERRQSNGPDDASLGPSHRGDADGTVVPPLRAAEGERRPLRPRLITKLVGDKVRMRIWIGEGDKYGDELLSMALVTRFRQEGFAGATVILSSRKQGPITTVPFIPYQVLMCLTWACSIRTPLKPYRILVSSIMAEAPRDDGIIRLNSGRNVCNL